jgi:Domain of unknown function (DUF4224)
MSTSPLQTPFLSDAEVIDTCAPLVMPGAQCKYLASLGLLVKRKPNGRPLVARSEVERVLGALRYGPAQNDRTHGPNIVALREHLEARKNGKKQKGR